jgi:hypothetical protein
MRKFGSLSSLSYSSIFSAEHCFGHVVHEHSRNRVEIIILLLDSHLPDYLVRAFVKKLARLSLGAPTDAAFGLIPFLLNLVIRFPGLQSLLSTSKDDIGT